MPRTVDLIAYAGTRNNTVISGATPSALATAVKNPLVAVGWGLESSLTINGHSAFKLISAVSPDHGAQYKVLIYAQNSSPSARVHIRVMTSDESIFPSSPDRELQLVLSTTYRLMANKWQFTWLRPGTTGGSQNAGLVSMLHIPPFVLSAKSTINCFIAYEATQLRLGLWAFPDRFFSYLNDSDGERYWESGFTDTSRIRFCFVGCRDGAAPGSGLVWTGPNVDPTMSAPSGWYPLVSPAAMAWGDTGAVIAKIKGFLWDALIFDRDYIESTNLTYDNHSFQNFTAHSGGDTIRAALMFCTAGTP
jgi:hypothetical protein